MPITEKQREQRRKHIGASDVPAILGLIPQWKTAAAVWHEKVFETDDVSSDVMELGNLLEAPLIGWAARQLGVKVIRNQRRVKGDGVLAASHDALIRGRPESIEVKTSGLARGYAADEWGEDGTGDCPVYVAAQCQAQMYVSDLERVWVPALLGGHGRPHLYCVERDDESIKFIVNFCRQWWQQYVVANVCPPQDDPVELDVLKRIVREPNKTVDIDPRLIVNWQVAKAIAKQMKEREDAAYAGVLAALGDAEAGSCEYGRVTYLQQSRRGYTVKSSTYRVARFKKTKELPNGTGSATAGPAPELAEPTGDGGRQEHAERSAEGDGGIHQGRDSAASHGRPGTETGADSTQPPAEAV